MELQEPMGLAVQMVLQVQVEPTELQGQMVHQGLAVSHQQD
jgi:hypothetical protein